MAVVWIPSLLQSLTGGERTVTIPGATLREVIDNLDARYPGIKTRLLDDNGRLQPDIAAAIDGETEHYGLIEPVRENSEVHFIPAISGGSDDDTDVQACLGYAKKVVQAKAKRRGEHLPQANPRARG